MQSKKGGSLCPFFARAAESPARSPQSKTPSRCSCVGGRDASQAFGVPRRTRYSPEATSPLRPCRLAITLLAKVKKGMFSHPAAKQMRCPQKTVWSLAHRIRQCMAQGVHFLDGAVEADEAWDWREGREQAQIQKEKQRARSPLASKLLWG